MLLELHFLNYLFLSSEYLNQSIEENYRKITLKDSSVVDIEFKKVYINNEIYDVIRDDKGDDKNRKRAKFNGIR